MEAGQRHADRQRLPADGRRPRGPRLHGRRQRDSHQQLDARRPRDGGRPGVSFPAAWRCINSAGSAGWRWSAAWPAYAQTCRRSSRSTAARRWSSGSIASACAGPASRRSELLDLKEAYRVIYRSGLPWEEMLDTLQTASFTTGPAADFLPFFLGGNRAASSRNAAPRRAPPSASSATNRKQRDRQRPRTSKPRRRPAKRALAPRTKPRPVVARVLCYVTRICLRARQSTSACQRRLGRRQPGDRHAERAAASRSPARPCGRT